MRKTIPIFVFAALAILATELTWAQTDYSNRTATASLTVGPALSLGASMIIETPDGSKVSPIVAYRIDAVSTYPLSPVISASLALGYGSRGAKIRAESNSDVYSILRLNYFNITPAFHFSAFCIGMNFGMPLGGTTTSKAGASASEVSESLTSDQEDKLLTLLEPRIGAEFPLMEDKSGVLMFSIMAGYTVNEYTDRGDNVPDNAGTFNMVAGYLGVSYQFAIPGTQRH